MDGGIAPVTPFSRMVRCRPDCRYAYILGPRGNRTDAGLPPVWPFLAASLYRQQYRVLAPQCCFALLESPRKGEKPPKVPPRFARRTPHSAPRSAPARRTPCQALLVRGATGTRAGVVEFSMS